MVWFYTLISVIIVSLISLVGIFTLSWDQKKLYRRILFLVSFSAGTLLGDAFIHLIPEAYENPSNRTAVSIYILFGILLFFVLEKIVHWRHCHERACEDHPHPFTYNILMGDALHNFVDGMVVAASFLVSVPVGVATTIAVVLHEIPQEIGDFGSLVYGGLSKMKALVFNFLTALAAIFGAILVLAIGDGSEKIVSFLIPFTAGGFIYIATSDLIPQLHKEENVKKSIGHLIFLIAGAMLMFALLFME
jgi:zinc and cadmium transporter